MFRSGPISPHDSALEQGQKEASSSSNLDVTTSQDQDITLESSNQDSLKRKIPDDGFDEDNNVRIFFFSYDFVSPNLILINRRNLNIQMLVSYR